MSKESLTKDYVDKNLGSSIVVNGKEGILSYEHNTGNLAIYSSGNKLIDFICVGDSVNFKYKGIEKFVLTEIRE